MQSNKWYKEIEKKELDELTKDLKAQLLDASLAIDLESIDLEDFGLVKQLIPTKLEVDRMFELFQKIANHLQKHISKLEYLKSINLRSEQEKFNLFAWEIKLDDRVRRRRTISQDIILTQFSFALEFTNLIFRAEPYEHYRTKIYKLSDDWFGVSCGYEGSVLYVPSGWREPQHFFKCDGFKGLLKLLEDRFINSPS